MVYDAVVLKRKTGAGSLNKAVLVVMGITPERYGAGQGPWGVFSDRTGMERILYAVFTYENYKERTGTPFTFYLADTKVSTLPVKFRA